MMNFSHLFRMDGSVMPRAIVMALPCAGISATLKYLMDMYQWECLHGEDSILKQPQAWAGVSFLLSFLVVFRTSQSYNRFITGCTSVTRMRSEWFDACCSITTFTNHSNIK